MCNGVRVHREASPPVASLVATASNDALTVNAQGGVSLADARPRRTCAARSHDALASRTCDRARRVAGCVRRPCKTNLLRSHSLHACTSKGNTLGR